MITPRAAQTQEQLDKMLFRPFERIAKLESRIAHLELIAEVALDVAEMRGVDISRAPISKLIAVLDALYKMKR